MSTLLDSALSNPFSTGSGGATFEQLVGASYLVSLLAGHVPRGLEWGITKGVRLQQRWSGCVIDDVVVVSSDGSRDRKLALQLKHSLNFTQSDETFARVIGDCWLVFTNAMGWPFDPETDRVGIGLGAYQTKLDTHFRPLLEWARTERDAETFLQKVQTSRFSSIEKREYLGLVRDLLTSANRSAVTDEELWRFLRCLVVIHFDLENAGSRDTTHCWNVVLDLLQTHNETQARLLFNALCDVVAKHNRTAGTLDFTALRAELPGNVSLKDQPQFGNDLKRLRRHSETTLAAISHTIGLRVQLPRTQTIEQIAERVQQKDIVVIAGEPMVGKSGLLKLLATRLQLEGEIFAFSVEEFASATTLVSFLHNNGVTHDFPDLLAAVGDARLRCILIDGLERATSENKRRVINDLILGVRRFNETLTARGGHTDYRWRVVFTCRTQEMPNILVYLPTRQNFQEGSLAIVHVEALTDEELAEVVAYLPKLAGLAASGRLKELLSRPLVLDILTLPDITLPDAALPARLTETWLLDWFWRHVVRLAEQARPGRGHPENREQLLIQLGLQNLNPDKYPRASAVGDAEALSGLVSDRLLLQSDGNLRFGHDALEDWSLAIILRRHLTDIVNYLVEVGEPLRASRAFQLVTIRLLEVDQDTETWLRLLYYLKTAVTTSPRWHTLAISALLESDLITDILPRLEHNLLENDNALLCEVLRTLRMIEVQPSPAVYSLENVTDGDIEKYLAYWNLPIWRRWIPIVQFVLRSCEHLADNAVLEFSYVARKWMEDTNGKQLFREEIARYAMETLRRFLVRHPWNERDDTTLAYDEEGHVRDNLAHCVLRAADCLPDEVALFVRQYALRTEDFGQYDFEEVILLQKGYGWIPLCKHLPDVAVDILEGIICQKIKPDHDGGHHFLFSDLGISPLLRNNPPTPEKGPFRSFLRFHAEQGLELIQRIVSHATRVWIMRERMEANRQPVPQVLSLPAGDIEVWGDEHVYHWYRYPSVGPDPVTCALMALEEWMHEQIQEGTDPKELFVRILRRTNSVAIIGVCASVALAHMEQCLEAVVPIIERPAFWEMDIARFVQDQTAEMSTQMFSTHFSLGGDKSDYQKLIEIARQPQRQRELRNYVLFFLLKAPPEVCERVQAAIRSFPEHPAIYFEHERANVSLMKARIAQYRAWAACAERENYKTETLEDRSGVVIQFNLPQHLEEERKAEQAYFAAQNRFLTFQDWCISLLNEGNVRKTFTYESAMAYAQELVGLDKPSVEPKNSLSDAENRANVIALFAAALVLRAWDWIEEQEHVAWCREQLLIAAVRPESVSDRVDEVQRYNMGYRRSAARALPALLAKRPRDTQVRNAVLALATHRNEEVRAYLFSALSTIWSVDDDLVWACIRRLLLQARKCAIGDRYGMLENNPYGVVRWGRFSNFRKLGLRMSRVWRLLFVDVGAKSIRKAIYKDIDVQLLQSSMYAIPADDRIVTWASDRAFSFLVDLVWFTVNNFVHFQKEDKAHNEWAHYDWNHLFFDRLANVVLRLPPNQTDLLLEPILASWEQAPSMMGGLLRSLGLVGARADLEDRLIDLWLPLADTILASKSVVSPSRSSRREIRGILGLLIFTDPTGIVTWKVDEWAPLSKVTGLIDRWVERVGHDSDCFSSLVRLLRGIGFSLMPEFGITWLYQSLSQVDDHTTFFEQGHVVTTLAGLLFDAWKQYDQTISRDAERLRQFVYLVDRVAEQGEQVAVRLQKQLQGL